MLHKVINFLLAVMFLVFAYLQLNDPDPIVWIPIYGVMAVVCVLAMFRYYPRAILFSLVIFYTLYSFFYIPGVEEWLAQDDKSQLFSNIAKMEHPFIEESREFLGLMINVAVLVVYLIISRKR
jgi:hypothetical protein